MSFPIIDHAGTFIARESPSVACLVITMNSSNITVLTQSHAVAAKKRKARRDEMQEVVFDDEARRCVIRGHFYRVDSEQRLDLMYLRVREFLTGFHKRKQKRIEEKQTKRKEREKKERLEARKQASSFFLFHSKPMCGARRTELVWLESPIARGTSCRECRSGRGGLWCRACG